MLPFTEESNSLTDVLIVGGGLVGACLAIALEDVPVQVTLLESHAGDVMPPVFDQRNLSFNCATVNALDALGVLSLLKAPSGAIREVDTSRVGDFGRVRMRATEYGRTEFGRVVIASDFGAALESRLQSVSNLQRLRPATFMGSTLEGEHRHVRFSTQAGDATQSLQTRLLVGADGLASTVRSDLGIDADDVDYGHDLFVAAARMSQPLNGVAYERLSNQGPIALLPRGDGQVGVVLGVRRDDADRVSAMSSNEYVEYLQSRFGYRAGRFVSVGERSRYRGVRKIAKATIAPHAVLVGNAAQSLHPVGAQGFNLGLRDALTLAEAIIATPTAIGSAQMLRDYETRRTADRERTMAMSHQLATLGTSDRVSTRWLRQTGLLLAGRVKSVQEHMVTQAMGLNGDVPALCKDRL